METPVDKILAVNDFELELIAKALLAYLERAWLTPPEKDKLLALRARAVRLTRIT